MRHCFTPTRITRLKKDGKQVLTRMWRNGTFLRGWGTKMVQPLWKDRCFLRSLKHELPSDPAKSYSEGYTLKNRNSIVQTKICTQMFIGFYS